MIRSNTCSECHGSGTYKVYNAYNPEDVQEVKCEYCSPKTKKAAKLVLN